MSNWSFRLIGSFTSVADVDHWARENRVSPFDVKTRTARDGGVDAEVRGSAYDDSSNDVFGSFDRKSGFR